MKIFILLKRLKYRSKWTIHIRYSRDFWDFPRKRFIAQKPVLKSFHRQLSLVLLFIRRSPRSAKFSLHSQVCSQIVNTSKNYVKTNSYFVLYPLKVCWSNYIHRLENTVWINKKFSLTKKNFREIKS